MLDKYFKYAEKRRNLGIPPKPLSIGDTVLICQGLEDSLTDDKEGLIDLLRTRVNPGVDPAAKIKSEWLYSVAKGIKKSPVIDREEAVAMLGSMLGGYNVKMLIELLGDNICAAWSFEALKNILLIYDAFDEIVDLAKHNNYAKGIIKSWGDSEWFTSRPPFPGSFKVKIFKVDGEINTDDFSPAKDAWSRPDIPLHALSMGEKKFSGGLATIARFREEGYKVAFVGDIVGTGSSRKSATNSLLWHVGDDIPYLPNKRRAGVVIGGIIAPIFFNTLEDSGGLPIMCDVSRLKTGDVVVINIEQGKILSEKGETLANFEITPKTLKDEFRSGGRLNLIIGKELTRKARSVLGLGETTVFIKSEMPEAKQNQGYSLAQKIIGKACGTDSGILPGTLCEPEMATVGSQDTTGPMTADELKELACLKFQSKLFMQSFCHTAAYPKLADVFTHDTLPDFVAERGGVALNPGDGIIHSWINRLILPDTVGTGGDSHTRFPIGISFPAGSGLVAFAGTLGFMPLDMPESVLVKFKGKLRKGITLRDVVNAIPYFAIKQGLLTVEKKGKKNIFNGRILEMEGLPELTVEQAYELTDASAERSAAAATIKLSEQSVGDHLKSNVALMKEMILKGYKDVDTLKRRIEKCEAWIDNPILLERDKNAEYKEVLEIDLNDINEPILACPNDPDDVKVLSDVKGDKIDEVFIGSCMVNIGHLRAAGKIWEDIKDVPTRVWICPPTKMDQAQLMREGYYSIYSQIGARVEIPGCSLCMGNQARVRAGSTIISTSTRNFDNRMGDGARVYLGSAELAAITAIIGRLPDAVDYFNVYSDKVEPVKKEIYKYLKFHEMDEIKLSYV